MENNISSVSTFGMPDYIEIEPTQGCNLKCRMCHVYYKEPKIDFLDLDRVGSFDFLKNKVVNLGAAYEPLIHPEINKLIDILNKNNCEISITTNAHFLSLKKIPALADANIGHMTYSFDGISKETYEKIRLNGKYENSLGNIENFIASFPGGTAPVSAVNFTVLRINMHEIVSSPSFWSERGVDFVNYIAMHTRYDDPFLHENSLWPVKDQYFKCLEQTAQYVFDNKLKILLVSPYFMSDTFRAKWKDNVHTCYFSALQDWSRQAKNYRVMFESGSGFGTKFNCKSPFTAARILPNADLMLCSIHRVGNLYDGNFEDIWHGDSANSFRDKIVKNDAICQECDYYRLCIDGSMLDLNNIENYYSQHMKQYALKQISSR
jgi:radical SAM protein with 4Fe4S-binding SPASM domain